MKRLVRAVLPVFVVAASAAGAFLFLRQPAQPPGTEVEESPTTPEPTEQVPASGSLVLSQISDNRDEYELGRIPTFHKLEISFAVTGSTAGNFQFPFDASPPDGVDLNDPAFRGISVNAHFTPDDWRTVYTQPAFYYQAFLDEVKDSWDGQPREWYYPTGDFDWRARFSPDQVGVWQYKLTARDETGFVESDPVPFDVVPSNSHGFIRVSETDPRYFQYDDGQLFFPLGYQGSNHLEDPLLANEARFQRFRENGINIYRTWISSMYGAAWIEWLGGRNNYDGYIPRHALEPFSDPIRERISFAQLIDYEPEGDTGWFDGCRFQFWNDPEAVQPNTYYRLRIKYWGSDIVGPRLESAPDFGLVGKIGGGWEVNCYEPGTSNVVTSYGGSSDDWAFIEGSWFSGDNHFLPRIYVGLENVVQGRAYVDSISLQKELGDGQYGPELIAEPSMRYESYFPEQKAYALDKFVALAERSGVHLKLVIHEKDDAIFYKLDDDGTFVYQEPDNRDGFYGAWRQVNKTRWLQQAWWRYLQARWGYSPAIHSWELANEGDPWNGNHWALADELGKFMHCRVFGVSVAEGDGQSCQFRHPNAHLVTTSFWHSFPAEAFWANPAYPNVDYADVHAYISTGWLKEAAFEQDAALFHLAYSADVRGNMDQFSAAAGISAKPIMRGETGIDFLGEQRENPDLGQDQAGVWLHNLLWSTLDAGAMSELYWWGNNLQEQPGPDGESGLYEIFRPLAEFLADIPLADGHYRDAAATWTDQNLRVLGQKDLEHGRAHLWIQNTGHTWRRVVDGQAQTGLSGSIALDGFQPLTPFDVEWHLFTSNGAMSLAHDQVTADASGRLTLVPPDDPEISDAAAKLSPAP